MAVLNYLGGEGKINDFYVYPVRPLEFYYT